MIQDIESITHKEIFKTNTYFQTNYLLKLEGPKNVTIQKLTNLKYNFKHNAICVKLYKIQIVLKCNVFYFTLVAKGDIKGKKCC